MWPRWLVIVVGIMGGNWALMLAIFVTQEWKAGNPYRGVLMAGLFIAMWGWFVWCRARVCRARYWLGWLQSSSIVHEAGGGWGQVWEYERWRNWRDSQIAVAVAFGGWLALFVALLPRDLATHWSTGDGVLTIMWAIAVLTMLVWFGWKWEREFRGVREEIRKLEEAGAVPL